MSVFNKLNIQRIVSDEERTNIYQTSEILLKTEGTRYNDIIKLLETTMNEETYYVIHDYELVKGKLKKLLGTVHDDQGVEVAFKTGMKEVFPDFDLEAFTAKFENLRLSKNKE